MHIIISLATKMEFRHIILLFFVSALLAGCGKEKPDDVHGGRKPICFSACDASVETKGLKPDDASVLLSVGNSAAIFASRKYDVSSWESVISNRSLSCTSVTGNPPTGSTWAYDPVAYWEDTGQYVFTAIFPRSITLDNGLTLDNSTYNISVNYSAGSPTDMMVARVSQDASTNTSPVNLSFKHATSAVRFLFGKSSDDDFKLTSFQIENVAATGTFSIGARIISDQDLTLSSSDWAYGSPIATLSSWTADAVADRKTITRPSVANDASKCDEYTPMGWYYMVPQTLPTTARVRFSVSYNDGTPVETVLSIYNVYDSTNDEYGTTWEPNCVYNYFITLNQSGVNLSVQAVPWDVVQVTMESITFGD